jgi:hypothetical protein
MVRKHVLVVIGQGNFDAVVELLGVPDGAVLLHELKNLF